MKTLGFRHVLGFAILCCATFTVTGKLLGRPAQVARPAAPKLISPKQGAVEDNGCQNRKNGIMRAFEWQEVPGAESYQLVEKHPRAQNPAIDESNIKTTGYSNWQQGSYVVDGHLTGWTWKVRAKVNGVWSDWSEERTFDVEPPDTDCTEHRGTRVDARARASAPLQVSPPNESVFNQFPRTTKLEWTTVSGAASYVVEIDCFDCCQKNAWCTDVGGASEVVRGITETNYTFKYVGAQPGRWRVWAVGSDGRESSKTDWWRFRYTR